MIRLHSGISVLAFVAGLTLLSPTLAPVAGSQGKKATVVGHVVDTTCYLAHDAKGEQHTECAKTCARADIPLAILETSTNQLYLPVASDHNKAANNRLIGFAEKKVKVTGAIIEKGGIRAIVIEKIEGAD